MHRSAPRSSRLAGRHRRRSHDDPHTDGDVPMIWRMAMLIGMFFAAFMAGVNVAYLMPDQPYHVSWWKALGLVACFLICLSGYRDPDKRL